jgi:hypothetical protein
VKLGEYLFQQEPGGKDFYVETAEGDCVIGPARTTKEIAMPLLIPVLIGIPVLFGGGYVIYQLVQ